MKTPLKTLERRAVRVLRAVDRGDGRVAVMPVDVIVAAARDDAARASAVGDGAVSRTPRTSAFGTLFEKFPPTVTTVVSVSELQPAGLRSLAPIACVDC